MSWIRSLPVVLAGAVCLFAVVPVTAAGKNDAYGFNAPEIRGFPTGAVALTGGGAYNPATGFVHTAGGFSCTADVGQGPLTGCLAGEGVRWDTADLLAGTTFKCTGADAAKAATTGAHTIVLLSDFYRAGDGVDESFTAQMIVSDRDLAPDLAGVQNVWVQGVGCGSAVVSFNAR
jgi:hypothetical protein